MDSTMYCQRYLYYSTRVKGVELSEERVGKFLGFSTRPTACTEYGEIAEAILNQSNKGSGNTIVLFTDLTIIYKVY